MALGVSAALDRRDLPAAPTARPRARARARRRAARSRSRRAGSSSACTGPPTSSPDSRSGRRSRSGHRESACGPRVCRAAVASAISPPPVGSLPAVRYRAPARTGHRRRGRIVSWCTARRRVRSRSSRSPRRRRARRSPAATPADRRPRPHDHDDDRRRPEPPRALDHARPAAGGIVDDLVPDGAGSTAHRAAGDPQCRRRRCARPSTSTRPPTTVAGQQVQGKTYGPGLARPDARREPGRPHRDRPAEQPRRGDQLPHPRVAHVADRHLRQRAARDAGELRRPGEHRRAHRRRARHLLVPRAPPRSHRGAGVLRARGHADRERPHPAPARGVAERARAPPRRCATSSCRAASIVDEEHQLRRADHPHRQRPGEPGDRRGARARRCCCASAT